MKAKENSMMKMTFRWYGESDCIPLSYIRQIPNMSGVVTAVYDVPVGEVWPCDKIARLKELCEQADLEMEVIESVPVHEDIKLGKPSRDRLIANYAETIRNLGKFGVRCICYNFMPVFDWFRTDLHYVQKNGAVCLAYQTFTMCKKTAPSASPIRRRTFKSSINITCAFPAGTKATPPKSLAASSKSTRVSRTNSSLKTSCIS